MSDHSRHAGLRASANGGNTATLRRLAGQISGDIVDVEAADGWDVASAEALMQVYEGTAPAAVRPYAAEIAAPVRTTVAPRAMAPQPTWASAPAPRQPASLADLAGDKAWLDERFSDLAFRIEQSLLRLDPVEQLAPIGRRLDGLESTLRSALDEIVRKDAFAGLEGQVSEVKTQLALARTKLGRLEGIEAQLRDLTAMAKAATAADREPAAAAVAAEPVDVDALASRMADLTAKQARPGDEIAQRAMAELKYLVVTHVADYRREQSQTASALVTMQEALVRLIDRIEQYDEEAAVEADAEPVAAERFVEVADERSAAPGRRAVDRGAEHAPAVIITPPPQQPPQPPMQSQAPAQQAQPPRQARTPAAAPTPQAPVETQRTVRRPPAQPDQPQETLSAAEAMAAERARVAAERAQAAGQPQRRPVPQSAEVAATAPPAAAAQAARSNVRQAKPEPTSAAKRGLVVAGVAALLIGVSTFAHMFFTGGSFTKLDDRVPTARATDPAAAPKQAVAPVAPRAPATAESAAGRATPPQAGTPRATPAALPQPVPVPREPAASGASDPDAARPRPRSIPETVTDELSANGRPAQGAERPSLASIGRPVPAVVTGIALDNGATMPNPLELARRMQDSNAAPTAPAAPAPVETVQKIATAPETQPEAAARPGLIEMPPALIGPSSLRLAAQQGDPSAQFEVAARFAEGKGIKQDFAEAITWYTRASQKGFIPAQYRLATLYERGLGTPADIVRAKVWYRRAADQGNVKSMHNLAVLAAGPQQAEPDYVTAVKWFSEAAERGLADSQFNLGVLSENGLGTPKDQLQAYKWFALAARSGDKESLRRRDQLMATFTPEVARTAEQLVANWRARPTDVKANDVRSAAQAWAAEQEARLQAAQQAANQARPATAPQQAQPAAAPVAKTIVAPRVTKASTRQGGAQ